MSAHTPGPWLYRPGPHDDWGWVRTSIVDEDGFFPLVACARGGKQETDAEYNEHRRNKTDPWEANARLIAAAPELLEVLKAFVAQEIDYMTINNLGDPEKQHNVKWARRVFAKVSLTAAEGQEKTQTGGANGD